MIAQLGAEVRKVFTTRLWWVLGICAFVYVGFSSGIMAFFVGSLTGSDSGGLGLSNEQLSGLVFSIATSTGYVFPLILGCVMTTSEFRSNTIVPTFLAQPNRTIVLVGKALAGFLVGLVFGVILLASSGIPGGIVLAIVEPDALAATDPLLLVRILVAVAMWCVIGVGMGALLRNQVAAIVIALVFTQFLEPLLRSFASLWEWSASVGKYLPGAVSDGFVGSSIYTTMTQATTDGSAVLEWWQSGLLLLGYAVVLPLIARVTTWRRDIA